MRLLLDADGLIRLHRAGVLTGALSTFIAVVPQAVYDEVVARGKARLHGDAEAIEDALRKSSAEIGPKGDPEVPVAGLGAGELAILGLLATERDLVVVSDDRRFLAVLRDRGHRFLTPTDVLLLLWQRGALTQSEASQVLDRLRPSIRTPAYWEARQDIERGVESNGQDQGSASANPGKPE
jgi:hypothetical protein